jgi:hypothetical protein
MRHSQNLRRVRVIRDGELVMLAELGGSAEAKVLRQLRRARAKDRQFEVVRINDNYIVGPAMDLLTLAVVADQIVGT